MKKSTFFAVFGAALAVVQMAPPALADLSTANCEVRKDGDKQEGKSGPCSFGQRQGYIDIDLRNGDTYNLRPMDKANHYRDQKGNKVVRTAATGHSQEFKWEGGKKVIVTFTGNAYDRNSPNYNQYNKGGHSGEYTINRLSNGGIEIIWRGKDCYASFNKHAKPVNYSHGCSDHLRSRSQQIAYEQL